MESSNSESEILRKKAEKYLHRLEYQRNYWRTKVDKEQDRQKKKAWYHKNKAIVKQYIEQHPEMLESR